MSHLQVLRYGRRIVRRLRCERGTTLVELFVSVTILGILFAALVTIFTSGANAESDLNFKFQAQSSARIALEAMRRDVHNACEATVTGGTQVTLKTVDTSQASFPCSVTSVSWCTSGSGLQYGLYRATGGSCGSSSEKRADYLTGGSIFSITTGAGALPRVGIDMTINVRPSITRLQYRLDDAIALRNARRV